MQWICSGLGCHFIVPVHTMLYTYKHTQMQIHTDEETESMSIYILIIVTLYNSMNKSSSVISLQLMPLYLK